MEEKLSSSHYFQQTEDANSNHPIEIVHVHDEFLQFVRDSGIENIAKEAGVINSTGEIPVLREYISNTGTG